MKLIIGCRHGESYKNLKDIYGGKGGALTEKGKNQVDELGKKINIICEQTGLPVIFYASCERVQIIETAHILLKKFNQNKLNFSKKFSPIRLGVFDGMSRDKQLELYPDACRAHQQWKNGEIDIKQSENCVEGMQPALEYYNQIKEFLKDVPDNAVYVLIGTRSDMSCIQNVVRDQSPLIDMAYKCYDFSYTQTIIALEENNKLIEIDGFDLINTFDNENLF